MSWIWAKSLPLVVLCYLVLVKGLEENLKARQLLRLLQNDSTIDASSHHTREKRATTSSSMRVSVQSGDKYWGDAVDFSIDLNLPNIEKPKASKVHVRMHASQDSTTGCFMFGIYNFGNVKSKTETVNKYLFYYTNI